MTIKYLIATNDGTEISSGVFDSNDRVAVRRFAERARQAWEDGYAVITKAV